MEVPSTGMAPDLSLLQLAAAGLESGGFGAGINVDLSPEEDVVG